MVRTCGNHEDAEDALAEALYAAIKASDQLQNPDSFRGWLGKIGTRSCARMRIRDRLVQFTSVAELESKGFELKDSHQSPDALAEISALKTCIAGAIELLPETYREVYLRCEIMGEKLDDVADSLNLSLSAIKSRLHRAREIMRESLDHGLGCRSLADLSP